jgi:hypothetical protein
MKADIFGVAESYALNGADREAPLPASVIIVGLTTTHVLRRTAISVLDSVPIKILVKRALILSILRSSASCLPLLKMHSSKSHSRRIDLGEKVAMDTLAG